METPVKVIITSKANLRNKYGSSFAAVEKLLGQLITSDKKAGIKTSVVYIDDAASSKKAGIPKAATVTRQSAKKAVDDVYKKLKPAYILLFGSQDVFPLQELVNPLYNIDDDDDKIIPSDLPYACDKPFSTSIGNFTGPTRVVGRMADIPGVANMEYLKIVFDTVTKYKPVKAGKLTGSYFAISADVWKKSTQESIQNIFGNSLKLKSSPAQNSPHTRADLKSLVHFYNCHGSSTDAKFYGQRTKIDFPTAQFSADMHGKISPGTIVAAECCYGAETFNPANEGTKNISIANTYFMNKAILFMGSSTIAYGPPSGNALADLITQYFLKNIICGASAGRALLEARQSFLSASGPTLDPYELKTLAQFYLLGDPATQGVIETVKKTAADSVGNRRMKLFTKGVNLAATVSPSVKIKTYAGKNNATLSSGAKSALKENGFTGKEPGAVFAAKAKSKKVAAFSKAFAGKENVTFTTFVQKTGDSGPGKKLVNFEVLVLKESGSELLGWRLYCRK